MTGTVSSGIVTVVCGGSNGGVWGGGRNGGGGGCGWSIVALLESQIVISWGGRRERTWRSKTERRRRKRRGKRNQRRKRRRWRWCLNELAVERTPNTAFLVVRRSFLRLRPGGSCVRNLNIQGNIFRVDNFLLFFLLCRNLTPWVCLLTYAGCHESQSVLSRV